MSASTTPTSDEPLLRDLVGGLSMPGSDPPCSLGIVGSAAHDPQPPAHCLRSCLGNDPSNLASHGCRFLARAARNELDLSCLGGGLCPRGFQVAAQRVMIGAELSVLISVSGAVPAPEAIAPAPGGVDLLGHLDTASRLVQRVGRLLEENAGFAEEVLQNYEQLALIFDLTQELARITDARGLERVLLERAGRLLEAEAVCVFTADGQCRTYRIGDTQTEPAAGAPISTHEAAGILERVRRTRAVDVFSHGRWRIIAGPLVRLDQNVDVVLALCSGDRADFRSGDKLLTESLLTFGGQIISNTELHERMRRMSMEVTRALVSAIDKKDHYTSGHSERGGFLTLLTARELGVPPDEQRIMEWAGLLHDVGKIGIPEEILCKPGKLTEEEFEVVKQHPRMGYEILKPIASFGVILDGVLYHHEYPDGSGYPAGLRGEEIPLVARIIHVVDTFDALTSTRSYRKAFTLEKAFSIIEEEKGARIDGEVADAFFRAFERYRREQPDDYAARFTRRHVKEGE